MELVDQTIEQLLGLSASQSAVASRVTLAFVLWLLNYRLSRFVKDIVVSQQTDGIQAILARMYTKSIGLEFVFLIVSFCAFQVAVGEIGMPGVLCASLLIWVSVLLWFHLVQMNEYGRAADDLRAWARNCIQVSTVENTRMPGTGMHYRKVRVWIDRLGFAFYAYFVYWYVATRLIA